MNLYSKFITEEQNPETGLSRYFDKEHYKSELEYRNKLASVSPKNKVIQELQPEILILTAYGVQQSNIKKILSVYRPAFKTIKREAYSSVITRWCVYYGVHHKELKKLIGRDYDIKAEQLIDFYIKNKDNPSVSTEYLNMPVTIEACVHDIRALLNKLLLFTQLETPNETNIKNLNTQEREIKEKINRCEDVEILNGYYAELVSILGNKNENRRNLANSENYKAIRILKTCGFVEAAYKWLDCFPKK